MSKRAAGTYCEVSERIAHACCLFVFVSLCTVPLELHKSNKQRVRETEPASLSG